MYKFVNNCIDEGNAPEISVNGAVSIERVSPNQVRVTYFKRRGNEKIIAVHHIWDREEYMALWQMWENAERDGIFHECSELAGPSDDRYKGIH